jgi:hypothetical protein
MIANFGGSIETALKIRLCPDKNPIANFERLQVFEADARTDADTVAKFARHRSPDGPSHETIQLSFAVRKPRIMLHQGGRSVTAAKMSG